MKHKMMSNYSMCKWWKWTTFQIAVCLWTERNSHAITTWMWHRLTESPSNAHVHVRVARRHVKERTHSIAQFVVRNSSIKAGSIHTWRKNMARAFDIGATCATNLNLTYTYWNDTWICATLVNRSSIVRNAAEGSVRRGFWKRIWQPIEMSNDASSEEIIINSSAYHQQSKIKFYYYFFHKLLSRLSAILRTLFNFKWSKCQQQKIVPISEIHCEWSDNRTSESIDKLPKSRKIK